MRCNIAVDFVFQFPFIIYRWYGSKTCIWTIKSERIMKQNQGLLHSSLFKILPLSNNYSTKIVDEQYNKAQDI